VRGYLDLALDNDLPAERLNDSLRRARSESRRMGDLVDDLLLLAQLDQGRSLSFERVDLRHVVEDAASDARAVQPARRVEIDDQSSTTADAVVEADQYRLRQVIASLVHNALVHTPTEALIRITIRAAADAVTVDVADNGPGLPPGFVFSVFDRFSRGETSRSRQAGGAGLGLAIARSIVEAHHGTITASAPAGSGCTFSIRIPRRQPNAAPISSL
jgi:two-component system OmpR family sensor kinase